MQLPTLTDLLADAHVVTLPMRVRFRGITAREALLLHGPKGWGEFGAFPEYDDAEAANWLAAGIEAAWLGPPRQVRESVPINATVPAIAPSEVPAILARFPGADTAKVKVAEPGRPLADDIARVEAVRAHIPNVRVDANGGWTVDEAVEALDALGPLQYVEQPCKTVEELARGPAATATHQGRRRREHPPCRGPAAGGAGGRSGRRGREGGAAGWDARHPAPGRRTGLLRRGSGRVQRPGHRGRHRRGSVRRRRAAAGAAGMWPGDGGVVRARRRATTNDSRRHHGADTRGSRPRPAAHPRRPAGSSRLVARSAASLRIRGRFGQFTSLV